jgi:hypothetical protein
MMYNFGRSNGGGLLKVDRDTYIIGAVYHSYSIKTGDRGLPVPAPLIKRSHGAWDHEPPLISL